MILDKFELTKVDQSANEVLVNLMELYLHDMAEWFQFDTHPDGRYTYDTSNVWNKGMDVYFCYAGTIPVGFAIIDTAERFSSDPTMRDMDEFFIVRRYRRLGLGQAFATALWQLYSGAWIVRVFQKNLPAVPFWRSAIGKHTAGEFQEEVCEINNGVWSHFTFQHVLDKP
jgi:predicted acetyltransferase